MQGCMITRSEEVPEWPSKDMLLSIRRIKVSFHTYRFESHVWKKVVLHELQYLKDFCSRKNKRLTDRNH